MVLREVQLTGNKEVYIADPSRTILIMSGVRVSNCLYPDLYSPVFNQFREMMPDVAGVFE